MSNEEIEIKPRTVPTINVESLECQILAIKQGRQDDRLFIYVPVANEDDPDVTDYSLQMFVSIESLSPETRKLIRLELEQKRSCS